MRFFCFLVLRVGVLLFALDLGLHALRGPHNNIIFFGVVMALACLAFMCFVPELMASGRGQSHLVDPRDRWDQEQEESDEERWAKERDDAWRPGGMVYETQRTNDEINSRLL